MSTTLIEVTEELIEAAKSDAGGWSRRQLALLGVPWPPVKGWRQMLVGAKIDAKNAELCVMLKDAHSKKSPAPTGHMSTRFGEGAIEAWTDGSCEPNPGIGGWGYVLNGMPGASAPVEAFGGSAETTSNRMEMTAIHEALAALPDGASVVVYSDSQYCVKGMNEWHAGWARRNWHKKDGQPMPNRDLWLALNAQRQRVRARFQWVKGHVGTPGNERADELAAKGRQGVIDAGRLPRRQGIER